MTELRAEKENGNPVLRAEINGCRQTVVFAETEPEKNVKEAIRRILTARYEDLILKTEKVS